MLVEATVPDTAQLGCWLAGFGSSAEVLGPKELREEFVEEARRLAELYQVESSDSPLNDSDFRR